MLQYHLMVITPVHILHALIHSTARISLRCTHRPLLIACTSHSCSQSLKKDSRLTLAYPLAPLHRSEQAYRQDRSNITAKTVLTAFLWRQFFTYKWISLGKTSKSLGILKKIIKYKCIHIMYESNGRVSLVFQWMPYPLYPTLTDLGLVHKLAQ